MKIALIVVASVLVGAAIASGVMLGVTRPWQSQTSTPKATPNHQWSETEAIAVVQQAAISGMGVPPKSCTASESPTPSAWTVTCRWAATACTFNVYENSKAVTPVEVRCGAVLAPRQQDCPPCECNY